MGFAMTKKQKIMKLWDKGFSTDKKIDLFTVGNDRMLDLILAKYDVIANKAHAQCCKKWVCSAQTS